MRPLSLSRLSGGGSIAARARAVAMASRRSPPLAFARDNDDEEDGSRLHVPLLRMLLAPTEVEEQELLRRRWRKTWGLLDLRS